MELTMSAELCEETLSSLCVGLDAFKAKNRILRAFPGIEPADIEFRYVEAPCARFTVLECRHDAIASKILLRVSSLNPIRHLPSNYQSLDFLRNFLMVFQHVMNDTSMKLDNMHEYFRPMDCPSRFLPVLADWLGIHLDTLGGEDEVRRFLQHAITLYRYRGTATGLRAHLAIVSGVVPEIIEGEIPYSAMEIMDDAAVEANVFEADSNESCFTVFFPVLRETFDDTLLKRLSLIVQQEKPVHAKCFISFRHAATATRAVTTIADDTTIFDENGISL